MSTPSSPTHPIKVYLIAIALPANATELPAPIVEALANLRDDRPDLMLEWAIAPNRDNVREPFVEDGEDHDMVELFESVRVSPSLMAGGTPALTPPPRWFRVEAEVKCGGTQLQHGIVYAKATTSGEAQRLATDHVHEVWRHADPRIDYVVNTERPEEVETVVDEVDMAIIHCPEVEEVREGAYLQGANPDVFSVCR